MATLFDTDDQPGPHALWHRPTRRHKWRLIGSGPTGAKALELMDTSGHRGGDWMLLDDGRDPNDKVVPAAEQCDI